MKNDTRKLINSILLPLCFVLLIWVIKTLEYFLNDDFHRWGIYPLTIEGLKGIITAPLIHKDFKHLFSNSVPLLISSVGILYFYRPIAYKAFSGMYLMIGIWTWCFARPSYHIGASGLVYGFVFFLFFSGIFRRDTAAMAISLLVTFLYGSMVWGILPIVEEVSWESHLMGTLAGIFFAFYFRKSGNITPKHVWNEEDDNNIDYLQDDPAENEDPTKTMSENNSSGTPYILKYHYIPENKKEEN